MATMEFYELTGITGIECLERREGPIPEPGPGQVLVKLNAAAINYRDVLTVRGGNGSKQKLPLIPLSDAAGEVVTTGSGVREFKAGDRVTSCFFPDWISGEPRPEKLMTVLGGMDDGVLTQYRLFPQHGLVHTPKHLSDEEACTTTCAGLTAWSALVTRGKVQPGDVVLVQGTGGVSLFALQLAKLCGAEVILISSSDEKLARAKELGADHLINYSTTPDWGKAAKAITNGRGVDHIVEVAGTLKQSMRAIRPGGVISLIGTLTGSTTEFPIGLAVMMALRVNGVSVGAREDFQAMLAAITLHGLKPVIDHVFTFAEAAQAFEHVDAARHFGKVVIRLQ